MEPLKEFAKASVTPGVGVISAVSAILGFSGTQMGAMTAGAWFAVGYAALLVFAVRIWWDQKQQADGLATKIATLASEVHGALEASVEVSRIVLPAHPTQCIALSFRLVFESDADVRVVFSIDEAVIVINDPVSGAALLHVPMRFDAANYKVRPGKKVGFFAEKEWPNAPRNLPGWVDGEVHYVMEYGAIGSEQRFHRRELLSWRSTPDGNATYWTKSDSDEPL